MDLVEELKVFWEFANLLKLCSNSFKFRDVIVVIAPKTNPIMLVSN